MKILYGHSFTFFGQTERSYSTEQTRLKVRSDPKVCNGLKSSLKSFLKSSLKNPKVPQGTPRYPKVPQGTPGNPKEPQEVTSNIAKKLHKNILYE
jgi:hypothetical protein